MGQGNTSKLPRPWDVLSSSSYEVMGKEDMFDTLGFRVQDLYNVLREKSFGWKAIKQIKN